MEEERNNIKIWELVNNSTAQAVIEKESLYDFYEEVWQEAQKESLEEFQRRLDHLQGWVDKKLKNLNK